ncbi:MAG: diguanylate cyclase, partial [Anaerolineae bacterium]|nr:diguanylate cyclase [Anaerolineae bacterium]
VARDCVRSSDILARLGGEEFAILLPHVDPEQAVTMAERLRTALAGQRIQYAGSTI